MTSIELIFGSQLCEVYISGCVCCQVNEIERMHVIYAVVHVQQAFPKIGYTYRTVHVGAEVSAQRSTETFLLLRFKAKVWKRVKHSLTVTVCPCEDSGQSEIHHFIHFPNIELVYGFSCIMSSTAGAGIFPFWSLCASSCDLAHLSPLSA